MDVGQVVGLDDRVSAPVADSHHELVEREALGRFPLAEDVEDTRLRGLVFRRAGAGAFLPPQDVLLVQRCFDYGTAHDVSPVIVRFGGMHSPLYLWSVSRAWD